MIAQGSPYTIFQRALDRGSLLQIRAAAADLPRVGLEDSFAVCLAFLDQEPASYPRAAAKWAATLSVERSVSLGDAQLVLTALGALPGPSVRAGAEALIEQCARYDVRRVGTILGDWLDRHGHGD